MKILSWKLIMENVKTQRKTANPLLMISSFWRLNGKRENPLGKPRFCNLIMKHHDDILIWCNGGSQREPLKPLGKQYISTYLPVIIQLGTLDLLDFWWLFEKAYKTKRKWRFWGPDAAHITLRRDHSGAWEIRTLLSGNDTRGTYHAKHWVPMGKQHFRGCPW